MKGYYNPETECFYDGTNKGSEDHIYVGLPPSKLHVLNTSTYEWELDLSLVKIDAQLTINSFREELLNEGFTMGIHGIRADARSEGVLMRMFIKLGDGSLTFPQSWRTKENISFSIVDEPTLRNLFSGFNTFIETTFNDSYIAKDAIELATTAVEVETIFNNYVNP